MCQSFFFDKALGYRKVQYFSIPFLYSFFSEHLRATASLTSDITSPYTIYLPRFLPWSLFHSKTFLPEDL